MDSLFVAALDEAIAEFQVPENLQRMEALIQQCGTDPMQKMMLLVPVVQEIQGKVMAKYGFSGPGAVMNATMQIQMHSVNDPDMQAKVKMLMEKAMGR